MQYWPGEEEADPSRLFIPYAIYDSSLELNEYEKALAQYRKKQRKKQLENGEALKGSQANRVAGEDQQGGGHEEEGLVKRRKMEMGQAAKGKDQTKVKKKKDPSAGGNVQTAEKPPNTAVAGCSKFI